MELVLDVGVIHILLVYKSYVVGLDDDAIIAAAVELHSTHVSIRMDLDKKMIGMYERRNHAGRCFEGKCSRACQLSTLCILVHFFGTQTHQLSELMRLM